jgi:hypothetical protein
LNHVPGCAHVGGLNAIAVPVGALMSSINASLAVPVQAPPLPASPASVPPPLLPLPPLLLELLLPPRKPLLLPVPPLLPLPPLLPVLPDSVPLSLGPPLVEFEQDAAALAAAAAARIDKATEPGLLHMGLSLSKGCEWRSLTASKPLRTRLVLGPSRE